MTETQAMSETAGTPADPAEQEAKKPEAAAAPEAAGKAAVGRASVPADPASAVAAEPQAAAAFTRPAGMPAPAEEEKPPLRTGTPIGRTAMGAATLRSVVNSATAGAVRVTEAVRAARTGVTTGASRGPRRARLSIKRVDPWSVMKFSFAVSFVLLVVIIVATSVLYLALDAMDVFDSLNKTLAELFTSNGGGGDAFKITAGGVIGVSAILGAINVVLFTALMTLGAFVYNVCADLVGGVEVTLAERE
ncbi:hypothetical protein Rhe02_39890 [Rhizocola hellebori]|uniref:DUF3566 domain-containing protein n=1 Tax=Rhizocola hellebori TaxID=1392758 RepID=A0A8J3VH67_9ACTN|nr:DUF3566 domain-containing protein [Rhizocola hellebori]GIH05922.1 hypothetical protein Rhe02_39890 [Rhizocola hellebori]